MPETEHTPAARLKSGRERCIASSRSGGWSMCISGLFILTAMLLAGSLHAMTISVTQPNQYIGQPVVVGNTATFPDAAFDVVSWGQPQPSERTESITLAVSPPGLWSTTIGGGDWGPNKSTLTVNNTTDTQTVNSQWQQTVTTNIDSEAAITVILFATHGMTDGQLNSIGLNLFTLTYLPPNLSFSDYVDWRKNDGTPAGYDVWRRSYGGVGPTAEPRYLWLLLFGLFINRTRKT